MGASRFILRLFIFRGIIEEEVSRTIWEMVGVCERNVSLINVAKIVKALDVPVKISIDR